MNPDFRNSTPQANDPAWLSLPNSISQSRLQLANTMVLPHPPPLYSSVPPLYGSVPPLYSSAAPLHDGAPPAYGSLPQTPLDFNRALPVSHTQSTSSSKNSTSSDTESSQHGASSREQKFIVGPAFSLADSREGNRQPQSLNASQTTSESHLPAPVISRIQSLSSSDPKTPLTSISSPAKVLSAQGPQICIGSVFSLADSHTEHTGQPETENEASCMEVNRSASRQTTQETPVLPYVNQQNMLASTVKAHSTVSPHNLTTMSITKQSQHPEVRSALNSTVGSKSVPGMSNTALDSVSQSKSSVSVEPGSASAYLRSLFEHCSSASAAPQQLTSVETSVKNSQSSENQKNGGTDEQKCTDVLRNDKSKEKSVSTAEPQNISSAARVIPSNKAEEPEVVDLDTEDIDDCLLVKIDLSRHHFPYGSKIHNSEVVIDDSDNEEDLTEPAKETDAASSERTSSAESEKQKSGASFSVAVNESDQYGPTGSLSMEVEEIITEANNMNSSGTDTTYTMSSTGETCVTSVMSSRTNLQSLPEGSCSTWRASETHNPEPELMDLHVEDDDDDDVAPAVEYVPLRATASQPDNDTSTPVIQSVYSSSSFLSNTTDLSVLEAGYRNPFLEPTPQAQITGSTQTSTATPLFHLSQAQITGSTQTSAAFPPYHSSQVQITGSTQTSTAFPPYHSSQVQITGSTQTSTAFPPYRSSQSQITGSTQKSTAFPPYRSSQSQITGSTQKSTAFPPYHSSQVQITGSTQKSTAFPPYHLPQAVEKDPASLLTTLLSKVTAVGAPRPVSMSHNIQLNSTTEETTNSSSLPEASQIGNAVKYPLKRKRKATKSSTPKIKIPSLIKTHKKSSSLNIVVSESSTSTQPLQTVADNSIMCKLCFMTFSTRMELVTHTWSWHRSTPSPEASPKCDECGKCFANSSVLKLHKKVRCTTPSVPIVNPGTMLVPLDSLLNNLIRQGVFMGPPQAPAVNAAFWGQVRPGPSTAGVFSDGSVEIGRNSTHLNVSGRSSSRPGGYEGNRNISTGAATETETSIILDVAAGGSGKQPIHEEMMQEDIKPIIITATGEILEQSQAPNHEAAGRLPGSDDSHKCVNCHTQFSDGFRLSLHQVSGRCKDARHDDVRCFACAKTFTSNIFRYLHVLNNPDCKDKADKYCGRCSKVFDSFTEKQEHLRVFEPCRRFEECLMKDVMKDPLTKNVGNVEQSVTEPESQPCPVSSVCRPSEPDAREPDTGATLVQAGNNSMQKTDRPSPNSVCCQLCKVLLPNEDTVEQHFLLNPACKTHSQKLRREAASKQKSQVKTVPGAMCPACKKKFATSAVLILHFNQSPKCRMKLCSPSKVAKKISASDRIIMPKPAVTSKSPRKLSKGNFTKNSSAAAVNASRNVFCDISSIVRSVRCKVCDEEFASEKELAQHHVEQKICKKLQTANLPKLKNLRIVLRRVSVMCRVCHLSFTDDTALAEHLRLNQSCQTGGAKRIEKAVELKKSQSQIESDTSKRDGKKRSCEIGTGISNVTSTISMITAKDGSIKLAEQTAGANSITNEQLASVNDGKCSDDSSPKKKNVLDKGNEDGGDKREAEDNSTGELISSLSSSDDDGSDMDESESGSSSEDGGTDYTCKQCSKTYASKSQLMKHNKSHHSGTSKKAQCKVCTRKFHDVTGLQAHLLQFKFCFIPLTRPLWERKQGPHSCIMCKKVLSSAKDLRKHCFKKMACRLRFVNMVLKNIKEKDKDSASVQSVKEAEVPVSKTVPEKCESQSANEVSSSVQDHCNPVEVDSSNSDVDVEDVTSCIKISQVVSKALTECLNCSGLFEDFQEHLLKQQSCLDFFGMPGNICPVPLQFCYQCKTHFADVSKLKAHPCKGFVAYTHACQTCGLKFTSPQNLHAHVQQSLTCYRASSSSTQRNGDSDRTVTDSHTAVPQDGAPAASSAVENVPSTPQEQSFPCLICDGRFDTLRLLMGHSYQHVEETPIACDRCNITFLHYNQFVSHQAFHIRMDKEANSLLERPPPSNFWAAPSKNANVSARHDGTRTNCVSTCIFCCKEFATVKEKLAHLINDCACLAVLSYVVKSKLFTPDQEVTVTDPSFCEFCSRSSSDKLQHYLTSACFGRLEAAILKYRSSQHPAQEMDIAVSQTKQKETGTRNIQSKHQGEHSSDKASPLRGPTDSGGKFSEEPCCLRCGRCFKTADEVKGHQTLFGHKHFLPQSVIKSADWQMPGLKCKICNVNYTARLRLIRHMVNIHSGTNDLSQEVGNMSHVSCRLCHKKVTPSQKSLHFENHRKKFVKEIRGKSTQSLRAYSQETCVFCKKEFFSRQYVIVHVKRHTAADIFPSQSKASPAETSKQFSANNKSKLVQENQKLESAFKGTALSKIVGGCSLCKKKVTHIKYHYLHFTMSHKDHVPERWKEFFLPVADLKQGCSPTKSVAKGGKLKGVMQKYRCGICHKVFVYRRSFMTHFTRSHTLVRSERWEEFFEKIEKVTATNVHTVVAEFPEKESTGKIQGRGYVSTKLKSCGKLQDSDSGASNKTLKLRKKRVSCKVCSKEFSKLRFFKIHFKHAHRQYKLGNWEDVYSITGTEYLNSAQTEDTERLKHLHPISETLKLKHTSMDSRSTSDDSADLKPDLQSGSFPSVSKKTAKLRPTGSCKLCNKNFANYTLFRFHAKKSHSVFTPEDQKRFFNVFVPSHDGDSSENSDSDATLTSSSTEKLKKYATKSKNFSAFNSFRITLSVCHVCEATFRDAFSYQEHLKTHIKPCKINLQELHSQLIPNVPGISKDPGDLPVKMEDGGVSSLAEDIITIDDESQEECLYPDSTTSEDASVDTTAEHDSCSNFSTQNKQKNSVDGFDYTNAGIPQSKNNGSGISESHIVFDASKSVIDTSKSVDTSKSASCIALHQSGCMIRNESGSLEIFTDDESNDVPDEGTRRFVIDTTKSAVDANKSESSIVSRQSDCMVRSEPGNLEMFSDDENDDTPNKNSNSLTEPTFGHFVHTVVDSLFKNCSSDEAREKSQVRTVALLDNCSSVSLHKQVPADGVNVGDKRKAHAAGFGEEPCSETNRSNLTRETLCKDQTPNDSSCVLESSSCEMNTVNEVHPEQIMEPQGHEMSCDRLRLASVGVEEETSVESPNISENIFEMREVHKIDFRQENQIYQIKNIDEVKFGQVQNVENEVCEKRKVDGVDSVQVQTVEHSVCEKRTVNEVDSIQMQTVEIFEMRKVNEVDFDHVQNVENEVCKIRKVNEVNFHQLRNVENEVCENKTVVEVDSV